jgi:hypothetical protein
VSGQPAAPALTSEGLMDDHEDVMPQDVNPKDWQGYLSFCRYARTVGIEPPPFQRWLAIKDARPYE